MPEPNLLPLNLNSIDMDAIRDSIPDMPDLTRDALSSYNLRPQEIEIMVVGGKFNEFFLSFINFKLNFFAEILKFTEFIFECSPKQLTSRCCKYRCTIDKV